MINKISFLVFCLLFSGSTLLAQTIRPDNIKIDYAGIGKSLKEVLSDLSKQADVGIAYNEDLIPDQKVTIISRNRRLGEVLNRVLKDTDLTYEIVGNQLVITQGVLEEFGELALVTGYVQDSLSSERLIYANVYTDDLDRGVETNAYGFYAIKIPKGKQALNFSYIGYAHKRLPFDLNKDTVINIDIDPSVLLNEIVISDSIIVKERVPVADSKMLSMTKMTAISSLGGEADVIRFAQAQTGVTSGADGFGGMNVRGGSLDQNLILLDGIPVYNPSHALGIFSVFNSSMIKSAELMKNGFPARYGGRLSSVLDIKTREGNMKGFHGDLSLGTMASKLSLEGPLLKDKVSFLVSARRTYLDVWIDQISQIQYNNTQNEGSTGYFFYDLNAKINFKLGKRHRIYFSGYQGGDKFDNLNINRINDSDVSELTESLWDWGNKLGTFRWNMLLGKKSSVTFSTYYSKYDLDLFELNLIDEFQEGGVNRIYDGVLFRSNIEDRGAKMDFELRMSNPYTFYFGGSAVKHDFNPGSIVTNQDENFVSITDTLGIENLKNRLVESGNIAYEYRGYLENQLNAKRISLNIGVHASMINTGNNTYYSIQPRSTLSVKFTDRSYLKLAYTQTNQFLHLLSNTGLGLPTDVWLPSTDLLKPEEAWQGSATLNIGLGSKSSMVISGYYKEMKNIIGQSESGVVAIVEDENWELSIPTGDGRAYGAEFSFNQEIGKLTGFLNYTYSHAYNQFARVNNGREFPTRFDRRHNLNTSWIFRISSNTEFTFNWTYGTGNPITLPITFLPIAIEGSENVNRLIPVYDEINNETLDDYHRLDLSFNFYSKYSWGQQKISLGVYNAYNRLNPFYVDFRRSGFQDNSFELQKVSIFPILPSISYNLAF